MKKWVRMLSYILVAVAASAATFFLCLPEQPEQSKLSELGDLIEERFIGEADRTRMEDAAASAMVGSLGDRWSYYISAKDYSAYAEQMENAYVGIGITISTEVKDGGILVIQVTAGGPAEEVGILAGDILTAVEGQKAETLGINGAKELIRGEEGTQVSLTVMRGGEEREFSVTRRSIQVVVAAGEMLAGNIGLVKITNFDSRCADETISEIEALLDQGAQAFIFDVRNNPGGYADELVKVLDYLLPEGPLFRSVDYLGREHIDSSDESCLNMPMAVLVNGSSYSAAEFFAAALSEYEAAIVVGEPTCGKGYFQNTFRLSDGSAVGLSVGKYFTPKGNSLADVGITPDIVAEVNQDTAGKIAAGILAPTEDPQIQVAITALREK